MTPTPPSPPSNAPERRRRRVVAAKVVWAGTPTDHLEGGWPPGWTKMIVRRQSGASRGDVDRYWYPPPPSSSSSSTTTSTTTTTTTASTSKNQQEKRPKLRSMVEVKRFLQAMRQCQGNVDQAWIAFRQSAAARRRAKKTVANRGKKNKNKKSGRRENEDEEMEEGETEIEAEKEATITTTKAGEASLVEGSSTVQTAEPGTKRDEARRGPEEEQQQEDTAMVVEDNEEVSQQLGEEEAEEAFKIVEEATRNPHAGEEAMTATVLSSGTESLVEGPSSSEPKRASRDSSGNDVSPPMDPQLLERFLNFRSELLEEVGLKLGKIPFEEQDFEKYTATKLDFIRSSLVTKKFYDKDFCPRLFLTWGTWRLIANDSRCNIKKFAYQLLLFADPEELRRYEGLFMHLQETNEPFEKPKSSKDLENKLKEFESGTQNV